MKLIPTFVLSLCASLCATACSSTKGSASDAAPQSVAKQSDAAPPVLYGRDGRPVTAASAPRTSDEPTRGLASHEDSRMYLLDLYQQAMADKDALVLEVQSLQAHMAHELGARQQAELRVTTLESRVLELEAERNRLQQESIDLTGRLTTAQIRRLEAEKALLERLIADRAREEAEATRPTPRASDAPPRASTANDAQASNSTTQRGVH